MSESRLDQGKRQQLFPTTTASILKSPWWQQQHFKTPPWSQNISHWLGTEQQFFFFFLHNNMGFPLYNVMCQFKTSKTVLLNKIIIWVFQRDNYNSFVLACLEQQRSCEGVPHFIGLYIQVDSSIAYIYTTQLTHSLHTFIHVAQLSVNSLNFDIKL